MAQRSDVCNQCNVLRLWGFKTTLLTRLVSFKNYTQSVNKLLRDHDIDMMLTSCRVSAPLRNPPISSNAVIAMALKIR